MNIIEALKSKKDFKQKSDSYIFRSNKSDFSSFTAKEILADDWEIVEKKIEITRNDLNRAFATFFNRNSSVGSIFYRIDPTPTSDDIAKILGLD